MHGLVRTEFKQQVDMGGVFEEVFESDDVGVTQTHLNGDLLLQLFLPILRLKCFLRYYFAREYLLVLAYAGQLYAGGKCAFSELLALDVPNYSAIWGMFFDYGARGGLNLDFDVFLDSWQGQF